MAGSGYRWFGAEASGTSRYPRRRSSGGAHAPRPLRDRATPTRPCVNAGRKSDKVRRVHCWSDTASASELRSPVPVFVNVRHVGGTGPVVAKTGGIPRVLKREGWSENEEAGTVRILDLLTSLFSMACDGGEGGIRTHVPVTRQDAFEAPPLRPLRYLSVLDYLYCKRYP